MNKIKNKTVTCILWTTTVSFLQIYFKQLHKMQFKKNKAEFS